MLFAAYVAADGAFAILAGKRRRGYRVPMMILEGSVNLAAAAAVLVWQVVAIVPLVQIATIWAMITGGLLLAAAHRLSGNEGRWILMLAGVVSASWGALVAVIGANNTRAMGLWLVAMHWPSAAPSRPSPFIGNGNSQPQPPAPLMARRVASRCGLCPAPAFPLDRPSPVPQGQCGRYVQRPRCDTICGPPGQ
jgi:hypothetical protein